VPRQAILPGVTLDPQAPERVGAPADGNRPTHPGQTPFSAAPLTHSALPLWRTGSRVGWLLAGIALFLFALLGGIGAAADDTSSTGTRIAAGVIGGLIALRLLAGTVQGFRAAFGDTPYLELHPELGLRLHDRIVLREPLEIPRAQLRAGAVEGPPRRRRSLGSTLVRFRVAGAEAWCWGAREGSRLPQLGHVRDIPNLALVFTEPIAAPRARRGSRTWMLGHPPHGRVRKGEPLCGLLCTVRDPELAERALAAWGLTGTLECADLDPVDAVPPSRRRQVRFGHYAVAAFVLWTGVNALYGFGAF
jgi:hypothetical protein